LAHPVVGELVLSYENLLVDAAADHTLTVFTPRPGSPEHDAVQLFASWHAASRSVAVQPRERWCSAPLTTLVQLIGGCPPSPVSLR
jgi:hypothetical protein